MSGDLRARLAALRDEWGDFEWQSPCVGKREKGHAAGFEAALRSAAVELTRLLAPAPLNEATTAWEALQRKNLATLVNGDPRDRDPS